MDNRVGTPASSATAPPTHPPLPRPVVVKFRDQLLKRSKMTSGEFHAALRFAEEQHIPLADALVALSYVAEDAAYDALSTAAGMPLLDLEAMQVSALAVRLVPERVARRHGALPFAEDNRTLTYATCQPFDVDSDQDVSFASGRQAHPALAMPSQLNTAIDRFYPRLTDVQRLLARFKGRIETPLQTPAQPRSTSPIVDLCDQIVASAIAAHASDVHIEPLVDGALVRYRIDGILETVFTVPHDAVPQMTNRFKVMGLADIAARHKPQDGAFTVNVDGRDVFVRLSTLPTVHGEKIVLRVIDSKHRLVTVDALGYDADATARLQRALDRPDGLVLVTGPTGCGKTTALYAPVERRIDGVNQIPVNVAAGNSFAAVLRSVLRQDPNVLMVGEIRDGEVAQIVGQAAYTGHLVLTSMHTADAASAMTRLVNLGLEPYKVAESLTAIVAQRLVRRLCPSCKVPVAAPATNPESPLLRPLKTSRKRPGPGCTECKLTGYVDRIPIAEVFTPTDPMRIAIAKGITGLELKQLMKEAGHRSMRDAAMQLVEDGVTSVEEVDRVLADDAAEPARVTGRKRVLVVDDDRMIRMLVRMLLQREGYDVLEAENGREGINMALFQRPDLMITDLLMPEVDGYEALKALRAEGSCALLPVIVLTAEDGPQVERTVLDLGADDYLIKPFDADVLLKRVRSVFARQLPLAS
jgi:type IV pilus assembly protein PilB